MRGAASRAWIRPGDKLVRINGNNQFIHPAPVMRRGRRRPQLIELRDQHLD